MEVIIKEHYLANKDVPAFLSALEEATGEPLEWEINYIIHTESMRTAQALEMLFGPAVLKDVVVAMPGKKAAAQKKKVSFPAATASAGSAGATFKLKARPENMPELAAWEVWLDGALVEKITVGDKNLRLASGKFKAGSLLHHPRAGWQQVIGDEGSGQGMKPMGAGGIDGER
jgi:hypothetical protein